MGRNNEHGSMLPHRIDVSIVDPEILAERHEFIARFAEVCSRLPDNQSQVIALRYGHAGLTQVETARVLDISRHTVQNLEYCGLRSIREDTVLHSYGAA